MTTASSSPLRFGDALAVARQRWVQQMARRLDVLGYQDYRRGDPRLLRWLIHGTMPISYLAAHLGMSRQATRKAVGALVDRGYAEIRVDPDDARRRNVALSALGESYARDVLATLHELNAEVRDTFDPDELQGAIDVLEALSAHFET